LKPISKTSRPTIKASRNPQLRPLEPYYYDLEPYQERSNLQLRPLEPHCQGLRNRIIPPFRTDFSPIRTRELKFQQLHDYMDHYQSLSLYRSIIPLFLSSIPSADSKLMMISVYSELTKLPPNTLSSLRIDGIIEGLSDEFKGCIDATSEGMSYQAEVRDVSTLTAHEFTVPPLKQIPGI